jgi:hypothetical protein
MYLLMYLYLHSFQPLRTTSTLYDATMLYAMAAHDAILDGISPADGVSLFKYLKGREYKSKSYRVISIPV